MAQIVPRDRISSSETFEGVLKGMKALLYVLLIIGVWLCAICSQGSLLLLTSALIKVWTFQCLLFRKKGLFLTKQKPDWQFNSEGMNNQMRLSGDRKLLL